MGNTSSEQPSTSSVDVFTADQQEVDRQSIYRFIRWKTKKDIDEYMDDIYYIFYPDLSTKEMGTNVYNQKYKPYYENGPEKKDSLIVSNKKSNKSSAINFGNAFNDMADDYSHSTHTRNNYTRPDIVVKLSTHPMDPAMKSVIPTVSDIIKKCKKFVNKYKLEEDKDKDKDPIYVISRLDSTPLYGYIIKGYQAFEQKEKDEGQKTGADAVTDQNTTAAPEQNKTYEVQQTKEASSPTESESNAGTNESDVTPSADNASSQTEADAPGDITSEADTDVNANVQQTDELNKTNEVRESTTTTIADDNLEGGRRHIKTRARPPRKQPKNKRATTKKCPRKRTRKHTRPVR